jgi:LacI family transcriptional regulator
MSSAKPTVHTLARATGLSLATVSRALSGSGSVLPATRERVLAAARELHYVRDRAAVRLKTGKTQVVAFMMDRLDARQPGYKQLMLGISDAMRGSDYHLIVLPDTRDEDPLSGVRYVVERGLADGLLLSHTTAADARVRYLQQQGFAFVTHGRTRLPQAHAYVDFANEQFAALAVRALASRGRQRLGILLPQPGSEFRDHLGEGFERACAEHGVTGSRVHEVSLDDGPEALYQWALREAARFDGLVLSLEAPALPLLGALADVRLQPGRDIDIVVKYSSDLPHYIRQPLLACFEDLHATGLTLGRELLKQLRQPGAPPRQLLFSPPALETLHEHDRPQRPLP